MSQRSSSSENPISYVVRLRERARRDITAAHMRFTEMTTEDIADEWRDGIYEAIATLASFPRGCPRASERFRQETRQLLYCRPGSRVAYRILFTLQNEEPDALDPPTVMILHVRHGAMRPLTRNQIREIEMEVD